MPSRAVLAPLPLSPLGSGPARSRPGLPRSRPHASHPPWSREWHGRSWPERCPPACAGSEQEVKGVLERGDVHEIPSFAYAWRDSPAVVVRSVAHSRAPAACAHTPRTSGWLHPSARMAYTVHAVMDWLRSSPLPAPRMRTCTEDGLAVVCLCTSCGMAAYFGSLLRPACGTIWVHACGWPSISIKLQRVVSWPRCCSAHTPGPVVSAFTRMRFSALG